MAASADASAIGLAFAVTTGAGLATCLGAAVVFWPGSLVSIARPTTLAAALGFSAGVMLFVSFGEILTKANDAFVDTGMDEGVAYAAATGCFFAGIALTVALDYAVHALAPPAADAIAKAERSIPAHTEAMSLAQDSAAPCTPPSAAVAAREASLSTEEGGVELVDVEVGEVREAPPTPPPADSLPAQEGEEDTAPLAHPELPGTDSLTRTSLVTALAIALHNFPEGLATFVATLEDPAVGAALAVAIAIHNIPEGAAVSIPVFYATGNKWRAFGWALLSGLTEPVGALLGYLVLATVFSPVAYGVLFGLVGGMMVWICLSELIPTALKYDRDGSHTLPAMGAGMAVMALSLVLFAL